LSVDWPSFTPWSAVVGGIIIGVAAASFALVNGRVAGISGIVGGVVKPSLPDFGWRAAFVVGLIAAPAAYARVGPLPAAEFDASYPGVAIAGLLVGIGTRYGAGCTSGHGVCGISRLSRRSVVATLAFMTAGFVTVFVVRHVIGRS
jgi:uncharacterized membrane protein YedE/YeeE